MTAWSAATAGPFFIGGGVLPEMAYNSEEKW
jgi:hypothetical protein